MMLVLWCLLLENLQCAIVSFSTVIVKMPKLFDSIPQPSPIPLVEVLMYLSTHAHLFKTEPFILQLHWCQSKIVRVQELQASTDFKKLQDIKSELWFLFRTDFFHVVQSHDVVITSGVSMGINAWVAWSNIEGPCPWTIAYMDVIDIIGLSSNMTVVFKVVSCSVSVSAMLLYSVSVSTLLSCLICVSIALLSL
jgi:hypothetical protein